MNVAMCANRLSPFASPTTCLSLTLFRSLSPTATLSLSISLSTALSLSFALTRCRLVAPHLKINLHAAATTTTTTTTMAAATQQLLRQCPVPLPRTPLTLYIPSPHPRVAPFSTYNSNKATQHHCGCLPACLGAKFHFTSCLPASSSHSASLSHTLPACCPHSAPLAFSTTQFASCFKIYDQKHFQEFYAR